MTGRPQTDNPSGKITLVLDQPSTLDPGDDLRDGLSAIVRQGSHLWVANDETTSLERLTIEGDHAGGHRSFDLTKFLELPGSGEIDIEGLDIVDDTLWLLGSHSAVRKRVEGKHSPDQARKALATVDASQRRQVLARLSTRTLADAAAAGLAASKTLQCSAPGKAPAGAWGISWQRTLTLKASYGRR
jgi:hypothetical protein